MNVYKKIRNSKFIRYTLTNIRISIDNMRNKEKRLKLYSQFIKKDDLCFDIGANFGNRTYIFLKLGAKVVAVDPQERCVDFLKRKYNNKITIIPKGIGSEQTTKNFYICNASVLSTFSNDFKKEWNSGNYQLEKVEEKEIVTLDNLINDYGVPSFIKIDVEGFEPEVLKGLSKKVHTLSFEYDVPNLKNNVLLCIDSLIKISDNIVFNYSIGESMELYLRNWVNKEEIKEIINSQQFIDTHFGDIYVKFV